MTTGHLHSYLDTLHLRGSSFESRKSYPTHTMPGSDSIRRHYTPANQAVQSDLIPIATSNANDPLVLTCI
jgi:hypothetical protein